MTCEACVQPSNLVEFTDEQTYVTHLFDGSQTYNTSPLRAICGASFRDAEYLNLGIVDSGGYCFACLSAEEEAIS